MHQRRRSMGIWRLRIQPCQGLPSKTLCNLRIPDAAGLDQHRDQNQQLSSGSFGDRDQHATPCSLGQHLANALRTPTRSEQTGRIAHARFCAGRTGQHHGSIGTVAKALNGLNGLLEAAGGFPQSVPQPIGNPLWTIADTTPGNPGNFHGLNQKFGVTNA